MIYILAILMFTAWVVFILMRNNAKRKQVKRPPGPWFLPILGHLPFLGKQPAVRLLDWKKRYGPIMSVQLGNFPAVILSDVNLIRKAFNLPVFQGRPYIHILNLSAGGRKGTTFGHGPKSTEQRRFLLKHLKEFGYGNRTMETLLTDQISSLFKKLDECADKGSKGFPTRVNHLFNSYNLNALWNMTIGSQVDPDDKVIKTLVDFIRILPEFSTVPSILMLFISRFGPLFPVWSGYKEKLEIFKQMYDFLDNEVSRVKSVQIPNHPRHLVDAYLDKVRETKDPESSFYKGGFLNNSLQDILIGGVEPTSSALEWTFYYIAKYPYVQTKLQEEIDAVVGASRLPSLADRPRMPYTDAVANEVQRIACVFPLGLFHSTLEDVEFEGYFLPKNTMVIANLYSVHNDPAVWEDPRVFRPERFINSEGKLVGIENVIPFSVGKRRCLAQDLANNQLFLNIASIFQKYCISWDEWLPPQNGKFGITTSPDEFDVLVTRRNFNNT